MLNIDQVESLINLHFRGRYILRDSIGAGGMGSVYLVESNDAFHIQRALKIIQKGNQDIYSEIEALRELDHHGIPKIIEVIDTDNYVFIVQELVKGKSLKAIIEENTFIPEETILLWINDIADVLSYLHSAGYIHRDIKPTNIMVTEDGEIKIIDFGLAKEISTIDYIDKQVVGTRSYTAPERYERRPADKRSDIYGFGSTCYYLVTGITPLEVTSSSSKKPMRIMLKNLQNIQSKGMRNVIERCLALNPDKRYQDFDEIRYHLQSMDAYNVAVEKEEKKRKIHLWTLLTFLLVGFLLVGSGFVVMGQESSAHYESLIEQAQEYYDQGNLSEAKALYNEAIAYNKSQLSGYQGLFEVYTKQGDYDAVIDQTQQLFSNNSAAQEDPNLLYLLGNAYYEKGEYAVAEDYLVKAVDLEPTIENHLVLGLDYASQGKYDQAQQVIVDLQEMGGDAIPSTYLSGQISNLQNDYTQAISSFQTVINNSTDTNLKQRAIRSLSLLYKNLKDYNNEISTLENIDNDIILSNDYQLREMLAEAYYNAAEAGNYSYYRSALNEFENLLNNGNNLPYIYRNIAIIYQQLDEFTEAEDILNQMEEAYPNDASANIQKAFLILDYQGTVNENARDYSEFVTEFNKAQNKDDGTYASEIQQLSRRYNELVSKGWL